MLVCIVHLLIAAFIFISSYIIDIIDNCDVLSCSATEALIFDMRASSTEELPENYPSPQRVVGPIR